MITGIQQTQDVNFTALGAGRRAQQAHIPQGGADTVELSAKKSKVKKGIFAAIATAVVAAGALFGLVKTGKLQKIENPQGIMDKVKNVGYNIGSYVGKGVDKCAESKVGSWIKEKGSAVIDTVKGWFGKKA